LKNIPPPTFPLDPIYYIYHGKNEKTMAKNNIDVDLNAVNLIASTTLLHGEIKSETDIRIDGELVGNLTTQGRLIVGPKGKIEGDVKCKAAEIEGKMKGTIHVGTLLSLRSSSIFEGEIVTSQLMVEPGANFVGSCKMDQNNSEI
jgi:cytoskeletal protein CcmA (bactofilin family)